MGLSRLPLSSHHRGLSQLPSLLSDPTYWRQPWQAAILVWVLLLMNQRWGGGGTRSNGSHFEPQGTNGCKLRAAEGLREANAGAHLCPTSSSTGWHRCSLLSPRGSQVGTVPSQAWWNPTEPHSLTWKLKISLLRHICWYLISSLAVSVAQKHKCWRPNYRPIHQGSELRHALLFHCHNGGKRNDDRLSDTEKKSIYSSLFSCQKRSERQHGEFRGEQVSCGCPLRSDNSWSAGDAENGLPIRGNNWAKSWQPRPHETPETSAGCSRMFPPAGCFLHLLLVLDGNSPPASAPYWSVLLVVVLGPPVAEQPFAGLFCLINAVGEFVTSSLRQV